MSNFVPYLTLTDYLPTIQSGQLNDQILDSLGTGDKERQFAEAWAMGKFRGKLVHEYDLEYEFTPTLPYDPRRPFYYAHERIVIDFPTWVASKQYTETDCVINDGIGYYCLHSNNNSEFNLDFWQNIGAQYTMYYIELPEPLFHLDIQKSKGAYTAGFYQIGDLVWWENHTYQCLQATIILDDEARIQYQTYGNIPPPNIFPNSKEGKQQWLDLGEYTVLNEPPTVGNNDPDTDAVWTLGDNRDPLYVQGVIDLALFLLHKRISPMNIPILRVDAKNDTLAWIKDINTGEDNTDIESLQPKQGDAIRWGSGTKKQNGYG